MNYFLFGKKPKRKNFLPQLFLLILLQVCTGLVTNAQISLHLKGVTLKEAIAEIKSQTNWRFLYNDETIKNVGAITVNVQDADIEKVMDVLTRNNGLKYSIISGTITITSPPKQPTVRKSEQQNIVHGIVTDSTGHPIPGVSVTIKTNRRGTLTNSNGEYQIVGSQGDMLEFSYVGYKVKDMPIGRSNELNVQLVAETTLLNDIVVVGYGTERRLNLTSAISTVKGEQLVSVGPVGNVSNTLGGNVAGLITRQSSGEPNQDASTILLRGTKPLVLIDGIERPYDKINIDDIASVSVLKDATAVAPYGMKGANGVVLITTKRGKAGKPTLTYSGELGIQQPTNTPDFMNSYESMSLYNEALKMDGRDKEIVADSILNLYRIGTDQYPNTNWAKNYLKTSLTQKHDLSLSGGTEFIKAFLSFDYFNQGNMMGKTYGYERYNLRSNVDIKATQTTTVSLDLSLTNDNKKSQGMSASNLMLNIYRATPEEADVFSNGLPAFQPSIGGSFHELVYNSGNNTDKNNFQTMSLSLKQEIPFIQGLSLKGSFSYDRQLYEYKHWSQPYVSYTQNSTGGYDKVDGWLSTKPSLGEGDRKWSNYTFQGYLNYEKHFGKNNINGLAVYERRWGNYNDLEAGRSQYDFTVPELNMGSPDHNYQSNGGYSTSYAQEGVVGRIGYNYDEKYLLEFAGRYDATYLYAPGRRTAFFPSLSIGWRLSREAFIRDNVTAINDLKIRASYGESGNPVGQQFAYLSQYIVNNSAVFGGPDAVQYQGVHESAEPNKNLTWESVWKANLGLDLSMYNGLLGLTVDIYRDKRNNMILAPTAEVPAEYGIGLSDENAGKIERHGIDLTLTNNTSLGRDLKVLNSLVFSFTRDKQIEIREAPGTKNIPRLRQTGKPSNLTWGYKTAGLFKDEADIADWAYQGANTLPGDIKYVDINGDGKIDAQDQLVIGKSTTPEIMWGYNLQLSWNGFDFRCFIQGTGNSDYYLGANGDRGVRFPFLNSKPLKAQANSWTTDNPNPSAAYPRLSATQRTQNYYVSDYWMRNSSYIRLKSLELGYNFKPTIAKKLAMQNIRVYASFYNVLTIHSDMPKDFDPETQAFNSYPEQFISTFGLNITF